MPGSGRGANPLRRVCASAVTGGTFYLSVGKVPNPKMSTRELLDYMNNGQFATICGTVVKEMLVMTSASSKPSVPMEKLKTLAESAAARLP